MKKYIYKLVINRPPGLFALNDCEDDGYFTLTKYYSSSEKADAVGDRWIKLLFWQKKREFKADYKMDLEDGKIPFYPSFHSSKFWDEFLDSFFNVYRYRIK